jgi:hypothetical protein
LWATKIRPESAASTWSASSPNTGASRTMSLVMLVMAQIAGGIGRPGLISVSSTTSRRPPCTTTTAISVIRSLPMARIPVVSTSTTAKLHWSRSGEPCASATSPHRPSASCRTLGSAPSSATATRSHTRSGAPGSPITS